MVPSRSKRIALTFSFVSFILGSSVFALCLGVVSFISLFALSAENVGGTSALCGDRPPLYID